MFILTSTDIIVLSNEDSSLSNDSELSGAMLRSFSPLALPDRGFQYGCYYGWMDLDDPPGASFDKL